VRPHPVFRRRTFSSVGCPLRRVRLMGFETPAAAQAELRRCEGAHARRLVEQPAAVAQEGRARWRATEEPYAGTGDGGEAGAVGRGFEGDCRCRWLARVAEKAPRVVERAGRSKQTSDQAIAQEAGWPQCGHATCAADDLHGGIAGESKGDICAAYAVASFQLTLAALAGGVARRLCGSSERKCDAGDCPHAAIGSK